MTSEIRLIVADDHELVRSSFVSLLERFKFVKIIGQAKTGRELLDLLKEKKPDVVLCDISMPEIDGVESLEIIAKRFPEIKMIMLSVHQDQSFMYTTMMKGARGYLSKNCKVEELIHTIKTVHEKGHCFGEEIAQALLKGAMKQEGINPLLSEQGITDREMEVLKLLCEGFTNKQVASRLHITPRTVDFHRGNLYSKTRSGNIAELMKFAISNGLVEVGSGFGIRR